VELITKLGVKVLIEALTKYGLPKIWEQAQ